MKSYELLHELPFYDDINISRKERVFRGYAETYKVEVINNTSLSDSLSVSKNSIKKLFDELLREKRGFKYIISVKITLKKRINDHEFDTNKNNNKLKMLFKWLIWRNTKSIRYMD